MFFKACMPYHHAGFIVFPREPILLIYALGAILLDKNITIYQGEMYVAPSNI